MKIPAAELPGLSSLSRDYLREPGKTAEFFNGDFRDPEAFRRQAERVYARPLTRATLTAVLREQNRGFGCGAETLAQIEKLGEARTCAIVTGQQVGLFAGPLYTIYKALTAVKLADSLESRGHGAMVPVFWLAADDHDSAEIDHVTLLNRENRLQVIRCPLPPTTAKIPVSHIAVPAEITGFIRQLEEGSPDSEFKPGIIAALSEDYAPGRPLVEAFARWMTRLFKPWGLIFLDPSDRRLRQAGAEVFSREIAGDSPSTARASETSRRLKEAGYAEQVQLHTGILNLFFCEPERRSIQASEGAFIIKETARRIAKADLLALVREKPDLFSPNVLLRPLVQDALLPTLAYIAGPGEISYFAQMKEIYAEFGFPMPLIYPRLSLSIVEGSIANILKKFNLQIPDFWKDSSALIDSLSRLPESIQSRFATAGSRLEQEFAAIEQAIAAFDPALHDAASKALARIRGQLQYLEKKIRQAAAARDEVAGRQLHKAADFLFPGGKLQERTFNIVPFLLKHGFAFMERLNRAATIGEIDHQVFFV